MKVASQASSEEDGESKTGSVTVPKGQTIRNPFILFNKVWLMIEQHHQKAELRRLEGARREPKQGRAPRGDSCASSPLYSQSVRLQDQW